MLCINSIAIAQDSNALRHFGPGERLKYKIKYGFITAAEATLSIEEHRKEMTGKNVYHLVANGKTSGSFNLIMKVRNRYDSYIDRETLKPVLYTELIKEGNYHRETISNFDHETKKAKTNKGVFDITENTLDVISAFYNARAFDLKNLAPGTKLKLEYFIEDTVYPLEIVYVGKEVIETEVGKFECVKFSPTLQPGRIFRKDSKMYLWISNDENRIPLKVEVEILIGSLVLELQSYEGLKNSMTSKR